MLVNLIVAVRSDSATARRRRKTELAPSPFSFFPFCRGPVLRGRGASFCLVLPFLSSAKMRITRVSTRFRGRINTKQMPTVMGDDVIRFWERSFRNFADDAGRSLCRQWRDRRLNYFGHDFLLEPSNASVRVETFIISFCYRHPAALAFTFDFGNSFMTFPHLSFLCAVRLLLIGALHSLACEMSFYTLCLFTSV